MKTVFRVLRNRRRQASTLRDFSLIVYHYICQRTKLPLFGSGATTMLRLRAFPEPFAFRLGSTDVHTALEVLDAGEYSAIIRAIEEPGVIVDLGANIGLTCMLWRVTWPACDITGVEPDADNMRLARRNLESVAASKPGKHRFHQAAVSSFTGFGSLNRALGAWAYKLEPDPKGTIPVMTVDDIFQSLPPGRDVDLLKCDIEGAEAELFRAPGPWIRRVRYLVVETHDPYSLDALESDLRAANVPFQVLSRQPKSTFAVGFYRLND